MSQEELEDVGYEYEEQEAEEENKDANGANKHGHYAAIQSGGVLGVLVEALAAAGDRGLRIRAPVEIQSECIPHAMIGVDVLSQAKSAWAKQPSSSSPSSTNYPTTRIPHAMIGVDVLSQAKSGMGKTAVFVLTILHQLPDNPKPLQAMVLCHTRELAYQIKKEFDRFTKYLNEIRTEVIFGGAPIGDQIKKLNGLQPPHIIVGTPGRVLQLVKRKEMDLSNVSIFVLDECDKMLEEVDMEAVGEAEGDGSVECEYICVGRVRQDAGGGGHARGRLADLQAHAPPEEVMMFSATMSPDVKNICRKFMKNQFEIFIDNEGKLTLHGLKQFYVKLDDKQKISKLTDLLDSLMFNQVIVFVKSVQYAIKLDEILRKESFPSISIHRDLPQEERLKRYDQFK
eukprot:CAMPEP_0202978068 /NCGR_PEP_ID=MMETSP1396-20130829/84619_1 /ASSEMBLY_ACC=CAM_ASM_000872 /TAXON_ID= /ORGANISM="Pseudokeronopsis sp., Strain Brazil" /LENGTH=397 /DNA_ID=CAMNT_0049716933 /DNA_START=130 /DNA_END=1326 /DNA_ORIENTATION=-